MACLQCLLLPGTISNYVNRINLTDGCDCHRTAVLCGSSTSGLGSQQ